MNHWKDDENSYEKIDLLSGGIQYNQHLMNNSYGKEKSKKVREKLCEFGPKMNKILEN